MEQQPCKALLLELFEKSNMFPLTVFQPAFLGIFRSQTEEFWNYRKNLVQFGQNAIFRHTKMSKLKITEELFWKNDRNVSDKLRFQLTAWLIENLWLEFNLRI